MDRRTAAFDPNLTFFGYPANEQSGFLIRRDRNGQRVTRLVLGWTPIRSARKLPSVHGLVYRAPGHARPPKDRVVPPSAIGPKGTVMRCAACSHENREGRKFCSACGARLILACPSCGAANEPDERFCGECGVAFAAATPPPPAAPRAPAAPEHLADKIRQARPALEGERKHITVLFADVKGSMTLAKQFDPEQWFGIVEDFLQSRGRRRASFRRHREPIHRGRHDGAVWRADRA